MGGSRYSDADYTARVDYRSTHNIATMHYDADIKSGRTAATVHKTLNPKGVNIRESRDSAGQEKIPIVVILDTTGSMAEVPKVVQEQLPKLMGGFLNDKASGKKYLGEHGYPDILVGACDDYFAMGADGALQIGQFESGMEIDDNITNLWLTRNGGGNRGESYDLALYFIARHTAHDHWDKRRRKGYLFILGDEPVFKKIDPEAVEDVIGDKLPRAENGKSVTLTTAQIMKELNERYHVIWGYPRGHAHVYSGQLEEWKALFGDERVIEFEPDKICDMIVGAVAMIESAVSLEELEEDSVAVGSLTTALAPLAAKAGTVERSSPLPNLPAVPGKGGRKRL